MRAYRNRATNVSKSGADRLITYYPPLVEQTAKGRHSRPCAVVVVGWGVRGGWRAGRAAAAARCGNADLLESVGFFRNIL